MESCRSVFLAKLYSVMTRPEPVRCGKWPWPVTAGQGCAHWTPVRRKNQYKPLQSAHADLFGFAVINHAFRR
jgi:hypothetical protein